MTRDVRFTRHHRRTIFLIKTFSHPNLPCNPLISMDNRNAPNHYVELKEKTMGQSLVKNYLHIIFSTKSRHPFIDHSIENDLYAYLGGICTSLESSPLKIGGHKDHVHILCLLS